MSRQFTRTLRLLSVATLLCGSLLSPAFSAPVSGGSFHHILCPGATRNVTNSKSLNSNQWDDVGLALTGLFSDNSSSSWLFAPGTTFVENTDGTARLTGTLNVFGYPYPNRSFAVDITFIGQTYTPPTGSPENRTGVPTDGWYYYHWGTAKLTGLGDLAGGVLTLTEHMKAFQIGIGANQAPEATDMTANGASGWFEWAIASQPTSGAQFMPYSQGYSVGDVSIICSGTPTVCTTVDQCHPDVTPPVITGCPSNINLSTTGTCAVATWTAPTATDNCSAVTLTSNYAIGYCFPVGTTTVTYTATDVSGNKATCSFTVTVTKNNPCDADQTPPVISGCPSNISLTTSQPCASASWTAPTATDNCTLASFTSNYTSGYCFPVGTTTVVYTATDAKGNKSTCSFTVTVTVVNQCFDYDVSSTTDQCGGATGNAYAVYIGTTTVDNSHFLTASGLIFEQLSNGTATLKGTIKSAAGNPLTLNVTFTGATTAAPSGSPKLELCVDNSTNTSGWVYYTSFSGTVTDRYGNTSNFTRRGPAFQVGVGADLQDKNLFGGSGWFTLTDGTEGDFNFRLGNKRACGSNPCDNDQTPPVISGCPSNINLTTNQPCASASWTAPTATDNCTLASFTSNYTSGYCFPIGTTTIVYTATDAKGNKSTCTFTVTVTKNNNPCDNDQTPPVISGCPSNINLTTYQPCASASWTAPTATDNCTLASFTSNYTSGYCFPIGTTTVVYTATDAKGNKSTCSFTVTVTKNNPCPDITGNTISKSCSNYSVVLSGPAPTGGNGSYEYMWLKSTYGCPTDASQAIAGANGISYTLSSAPTVKTYFVRCARQTGCTTWGPVNESNCITVNPGECARPNPCDITIGGNTISKSCANGVPVLTGPTPTGGSGQWEYMWLSSVWGCPTDASQAIPGATGSTYTLPASPSKTTYFVRCARQAGCTVWGPVNESACVTVNANECKVNTQQCYDYDVSSTKDYCGGATGSVYCMYMDNKNWGNSNFFTCESLVFEQQSNGTATLKGSIRSAWWDYIYVNVTFTGGTTTPPSGSPKIELCADSHTNTNGWVYYTGMSGTVQFNWWKTLSISRRGPAFQVGQGADLQDKNLFGASGWFTLSDGSQGDFNLRLNNQRACNTYLQSAVSLNINAFADYRRSNIEWTNNSGVNNDYFAVQKLNEAGAFDDMELRSAYAPNADVQYYQAYDNAPTDGDNFYRVKLALRDGTIKYSDIKKVTFKNLNGVNAFPNPADDHVDLDLTNYAGKDVTIYVYDQLGYQRSVSQVKNIGAAPYRVNLENANAGSYLIRIVAAGKRDVVKQVTVQK